ncbi:MAG: isochorismatase family protein [Verrucomicrobia bacterium]|nr:isochorismatase family protein [Verrucomicrobiota bacterium]
MAAAPSPPSDLLLLAVDLQADLLAAVDPAGALTRDCRFALAAATGLGLPVAFTEQVPAKLGATAPALRAPAPAAPVWPKDTFSALGDPALRGALLAPGGPRHLLLAGIETPICVYQTAIDALRAELEVTVLIDCVGARRPADAAAALAALARLGCHLLPAETVFYALAQDARHPFFRGLTTLVKERAGNHGSLALNL